MIQQRVPRFFRVITPKKISGFTLLELLVVLALAGLLLAVVIPRLTKIYQGVRSSLSRSQMEMAINELGALAHKRGKLLILSAGNPHPVPVWLKFPPGWKMTVDQPIRFYPSGVCTGGEVILSYNGVRYPAILKPPVCRIKML